MPHDAVYVALAHPTRRAILDVLREKDDVTVKELRAATGTSSQPETSKHLAILRRAGLVVSQQVGRRRRYSLTSGPLEDVIGWVVRYRWHIRHGAARKEKAEARRFERFVKLSEKLERALRRRS